MSDAGDAVSIFIVIPAHTSPHSPTPRNNINLKSISRQKDEQQEQPGYQTEKLK